MRGHNTLFNLHPRFAFGSASGNGSLPAFSADFSGSTFPSNLTASRVSSATYWDSAAVLQSAASNVMRYDYNPQTLQPRGWLIEAQPRTNFLLNSTAPVTQVVDLAAGTYTLWANGTGSVASSATTAIGTGFGSASGGVDGTFGTPNTFVVTTAGTVTFTVTGTLKRFQCELGISPSSFIITTVSAATRAADIVGAGNPAWYNLAEGTFVVQFAIEGLNGSRQVILSANDMNNGSRYVRISVEPNGVIRAWVGEPSSGGSQALLDLGTAVAGTVYKVAFGYKNNDFGASLNGGTAIVDTSGVVPSIVDIFRIGSTNGGDSALAWYSGKFSYYNTKMSNAQLQTLSTPDLNFVMNGADFVYVNSDQIIVN